LSDITRIGVIGCGLMGSGIAEVCARAGLDVIVRDVDDAAAATGRARIETSLARAVKAGKISGMERDAALERVTVTTDLGDLADQDLIIEAAAENPDVKAALFAELDRVVKRPEAILATNTSSIPIVVVARATTRPEQVIGLHFFNPAPVQRLVEVIPSVLTGPETAKRARGFVAEPSARPPSARLTGRGSWSTPCLFPTCCPLSGCSRQVSCSTVPGQGIQ
jgi:3-hydroxybutyryl-CoA dehydrogenase